MKELTKKFSLSYADLCTFTSNLVANMTRDTVQFAVRGVNAGAITALESLGNAFELFPPDEVYVGDIKDITLEKNILREQVTEDIKIISGFFEQKYGLYSGKYTSLRISKLQKMSDGNFLLSARNVVTQATAYLSALTSIGLTQTMIDTLEDDTQLLEDKLIELNTKRELRDSKAEERLIKGNELYDYVSEYCKIGKLIWEIVSEAKYNDYVIYPSVNSGLSKPQNLSASYDPLNPPNLILTWDLVLEATSYDIYYDIANTGAPSGTYQFLNTFASSPAEIPAIIAKRNYFKIKARAENKTSDYSDETFVDVPFS